MSNTIPISTLNIQPNNNVINADKPNEANATRSNATNLNSTSLSSSIPYTPNRRNICIRPQTSNASGSRYGWQTPLEKAKAKLQNELKRQANKAKQQLIRPHTAAPTITHNSNNKNKGTVGDRPQTSYAPIKNVNDTNNNNNTLNITRPSWWRPVDKNENIEDCDLECEIDNWKRRFGYHFDTTTLNKYINKTIVIPNIPSDPGNNNNNSNNNTANTDTSSSHIDSSITQQLDNSNNSTDGKSHGTSDIFNYVYGLNNERKPIREFTQKRLAAGKQEKQRLKQAQQIQQQEKLKLYLINLKKQEMEKKLKSVNFVAGEPNNKIYRIKKISKQKSNTDDDIDYELKLIDNFIEEQKKNAININTNHINNENSNDNTSNSIDSNRYNPSFHHPAYQILFPEAYYADLLKRPDYHKLINHYNYYHSNKSTNLHNEDDSVVIIPRKIKKESYYYQS